MAQFSKESILQDMQEAADRMGLDLADLSEMIQEVIEDCLEKAQKTLAAIDSGDAEAIRALAHDIKGSTANYGLNAASALALAVEKGDDATRRTETVNLIACLEAMAKLDLAG